jgi:hypothetical protein
VFNAEFITERLAEYSSLMVLKQKYGDAKMRRFLKHELDRCLMGRGLEQKGEQPLLRADGAAYRTPRAIFSRWRSGRCERARIATRWWSTANPSARASIRCTS